MNILLFVIQDTYTGGAEGVLYQVSQYYLKRGHQVYVLFLKAKGFGHWEEKETPNLHLIYGGGICKTIYNINRIRKIHFAISYSSLVTLTGILGILRTFNLLHVDKMVGRESTSVFDRFSGFDLWRKKMMYRLGYPSVDIIICQTSYMKDSLIRNIPWIAKEKKVVVIPNPIDIETIKNNSITSEISVDYPYVVTAGRFIPEKGYDILIDAFALFKKKYPEYHLVILGDGEKRSEYEKQIKELGLDNCIYMPGFSKNVFPWFRQANLCVISSRVEGFPNVLLQMMSQNSRVVSTLCAGDIDKIKGLATCIPNSVDKLAETMEEAMNNKDTGKNRVLFDEELKSRSIVNFVNTVEQVN